MKQPIGIGLFWILAIYGVLGLTNHSLAFANKKCAPCYQWNKKQNRCTFRCRVGKELCFRGRCIAIKKCAWSKCERLNLRTYRCESVCRSGAVCERGKCRPSCSVRQCYDRTRQRCVPQCPRGKRCVRKICQ